MVSPGRASSTKVAVLFGERRGLKPLEVVDHSGDREVAVLFGERRGLKPASRVAGRKPSESPFSSESGVD